MISPIVPIFCMRHFIPTPYIIIFGNLERSSIDQLTKSSKEGVKMANVHDVAAYILKKRGTMTAMKLQKLVYYSQAWSLVWDEKPLFQEKIEAWANGPVVRELYERHKSMFQVSTWRGNPDALTPEEKETVDKVLEFYGKMPSQQLSDLTHREDPWKDSRALLVPSQRGNEEITHAAMAEYYDKVLHHA